MEKILIFGPGWLGHKFKDYLYAELTDVDITDAHAVSDILDRIRPHIVLNAAGKTGKPNVDWCEDHKLETFASNVMGPLILFQECMKRNIFLAHLSSGCVFDGESPGHAGFTENDPANPVSFYSWTKAQTDELLKKFPVLILRIRMPVDKEPSPRNLITKLANYTSVIDVENSITVIDDLMFATQKLIQKRKTGIYNVVNPGTVKHKDILLWYKEIVDPTHTYTLITKEELFSKGLAKAGRSNCVLDTTKLQSEGILLKNAKERVIECLKEYKTYIKN